ncbi:MAG: tetratricopeptide (TPR) repeat protein, partial [Kiritimatiellia bacterium]
EKQQTSVAMGNASVDPSAPEINLSMEPIEEVLTRTAVPNLKTSIEFDDEEDYVLPTSVGTAKESAAGSDVNLAQNLSGKNEASIEREQPNLSTAKNTEASPGSPEIDLAYSRTSPKLERQQESKAEHEAFDLDSFESEEHNRTASEEAAAKTVMASGTKEPDKRQSSRLTVSAAEQARVRARDRDEPGRKTARRVFAAKKSPLLKNLNIKVAAGGALALVIVAFSTYFYISLNQESTFNIPVGSYATAGFVDDGVSSGEDGDQLSIDVVTGTETGETVTINVADNASEQLLIPEDVDAGGVSVTPNVADTLIEPAALEVVVVPQAIRSAANLQPETIVEEMLQSEPAVTTIGDTPATAVESEIVVQSVASIGVQSAEPTNLISFKKQETVATVDPNVDRAYAAYQQGSLDQAEVLYRQTLARDPRQRDALLGLANITARNGNTTEALDLYSRLLARNPSDPIARAGLMELLPAGSPSQQEAELKRLLNDHPDVAALSYAYGNFLASNQRWSEAQQAYFRALQLAKSDTVLNGVVNPDYAFNLAVSLEHLNQGVPAQNYYREALDYSANHPAGFDLTAVRSRLANMAGNGNDD